MSPRVFFYLLCAGCAYSQAVHFQWVQQIGGSLGQVIVGIGSDAAGNTYVVGNTASLDFPVLAPVQGKPGGSGLFRVNETGQVQNLYGAGLATATVLTADPSNPGTFYVSDGQRLLQTKDGGATFTQTATFSSILNGLAVSSGDGVLYAATGTGVFKSTDSGATWAPANNGISTGQQGQLYALGIWADPKQSSVVFASSSSGLARSSDAGATWQIVAPGDEFFSLSQITFDPSKAGVIYIGSTKGVLKSTDDGVTWNALPVPPNIQFYPTIVALDPIRSGRIYAGSYNGLWRSVDNGNSWTQVMNQQVSAMAIDASGTLYYGASSSLYASKDGLATSTKVGPSIQYVWTIAIVGGRPFVGSLPGSDVFVAKLDGLGNLVYATYFGGAASDLAQAMAVDSSGGVYVTGSTNSSDFPVTQRAFAQSGSSFLFKLNGDGSLAYSTYFAPGGSFPVGIAVDSSGSAYLAGASSGGLPTTAGAYQTTIQGTALQCCTLGPGLPPLTNGFVTKFAPSGGSLVYSTYFGSQYVAVSAMALKPNGEVVVAGGGNMFRLNADGSALLGITGLDATIRTLLADGAGNLYVGGSTGNFYQQTFPVTPGAFETAPPIPSNLGYGYGFVTRFDSEMRLTASTLLGGEAGDSTQALAIGPNGNLFAGGYTNSKAFPLRGPAQGSFSRSTGFVAELSPDLTSAVFSTVAGDTRTFSVQSLAPTSDGGVVFAGDASTNEQFIGASLASDVTPSDLHAFVVKASVAPASPRVDSVINAASFLGIALSPGVTFTVNGAGFGDDATLLLNGNPVPLLSHSPTALTAAVPLEFSASGAVTVTVQSGGNTSNAFTAQFLSTGPGIFSADGSGVGQSYVLNADGTLNSPSNPAKEGSAITVFATGVGHMSFTQGYAVTDAPVIVAVDGFGAPGIAAVLGPVDGFPGNVYQISVYVPKPSDFASVNPGLTNYKLPSSSPIYITVNGVTSQNGLYLSVDN